MNITEGSPHSSRQTVATYSISVKALLPVSAALLVALTGAVPSAADRVPEEGTAGIGAEISTEQSEQSELGDLRVELATARADVEALREAAVEKIERYEDESARLEELTGAREAAESRAENAEERHEAGRLGAARQAASAYKGDDLSMLHAWTGPEGPAEALERGAYISLFGERRSADLDRAEASRTAADTLAEAVTTAEQEQDEATEAASAAREAAEEAIEEQEELAQDLLDRQTRLETSLADTRDSESDEERHEEALTNARAAGSGETSQAATTECTRGGSGGHTNGRMPESELCPLPQAGEKLRADAAQAFIELDGDFRTEFGRPMCVTDSYRPYHEQVRLFQEMMPGMAARPGTSAHGLGIAVDLCGGVNRLGTAEHQWMLDHGPGHGWHNPDWARGGFEPWHWEYTP